MILSVYFLLRTTFDTIQCAPKLGHVLFDPLLYELKIASSSKETPIEQENWLKENLRKRTRIEENSKTPCSGYDYNETLCKTVDDRVVCGYNKNIGNISDKIVNIGNKCRIRDDRLECGYIEGPFKFPRRPPANDEVFEKDNITLHLRYRPTRTTNILTKLNVTRKQNNYYANITTPKQTQNLKFTSNNTKKTSILIRKSSPTTSSILKTSLLNYSSFFTASRTNFTSSIRPKILRRQFEVKKPKRYCVDKRDSIFCQYIE
ncbi:unnamed protein product [Euphydryas editha]|uniref:Uncharacterized protein n=1 Tax=Euphydryas editha TaxID=104508 RepID=A0AAU9TUX0_EUPED|nr:unnamed protein product [Euphydryas editha]